MVDLSRHGRVLLRFWSTSLASQTEYLFNFAVELLAMAGNLAGSWFVLSLFFRHGQQLGGWSWAEALVVLGAYTLLDGLATTLLRPNLNAIVTLVQNGSLDFVLLKPIDSQFWLSTRLIAPVGVPQIVLGAGLMLWAAGRAGAPQSPLALASTALLLLAASVSLYSLWFLVAATSIWFTKIWNATEVLRNVLVAGRYPISAYPAGVRSLLTLVLPVAFLTTVPAEALLGRARADALPLALLVALGLFTASRLFWRHALRFYTSASS